LTHNNNINRIKNELRFLISQNRCLLSFCYYLLMVFSLTIILLQNYHLDLIALFLFEFSDFFLWYSLLVYINLLLLIRPQIIFHFLEFIPHYLVYYFTPFLILLLFSYILVLSHCQNAFYIAISAIISDFNSVISSLDSYLILRFFD
jgi:hypothetical protein